MTRCLSKVDIEDVVKTIQLKAGDKYEGKTPDGGEYQFEVAGDCEYDVSAVVSDDTDEVIRMEIRDNDAKADSEGGGEESKEDNESK